MTIEQAVVLLTRVAEEVRCHAQILYSTWTKNWTIQLNHTVVLSSSQNLIDAIVEAVERIREESHMYPASEWGRRRLGPGWLYDYHFVPTPMGLSSEIAKVDGDANERSGKNADDS